MNVCNKECEDDTEASRDLRQRSNTLIRTSAAVGVRRRRANHCCVG
ncbi:hypothetical protein Hdeb2414_s0012g00390421 [Helianthus debilis subsp. tardiflorus]